MIIDNPFVFLACSDCGSLQPLACCGSDDYISISSYLYEIYCNDSDARKKILSDINQKNHDSFRQQSQIIRNFHEYRSLPNI